MRYYNYLNEGMKQLKWPIEKVAELADPNVPLEKVAKEEKKYIEKIKDLIISGKLEDPIEIMVKNNKPWKIWDGMHRLIAYKQLDFFEEVPVKFIDENENPLNKPFYPEDM